MKQLSRQEFTQHVNKHENRAGTRGKAKAAEKPPALCSICGKSYKTKSLLDTHIAAGHGTERPFACEVPGCGLTFKIRKYLKVRECSFCHFYLNTSRYGSIHFVILI
jgi:hypothetical protein